MACKALESNTLIGYTLAMSLKRPFRRIWLFSLFVDLLAVVCAYYSAVYLRLHSEWGRELYTILNSVLGVKEPGELGEHMRAFYSMSGPRIILILCATVCLLYALLDLYAGRRFLRRRPVAWNVLLANAIALVLFYSYFYARWNTYHPRTVFITIMAFNVLYCVAFRAFVERSISLARRRVKFDVCPTILVGTGEQAELIEEFIDAGHPQGVEIVDYLRPETGPYDKRLMGQIEESVREHDVAMIICAGGDMGIRQLMDIIALSGELGVSAKIMSEALNVVATQAHLQVDIIRGVPLVHFEAVSGNGSLATMRRVVGFALSALALLLLSPLLLLIAVAVKMTSDGPAVYVQDRIGFNRKQFKMYKFRTMYHLADEQQDDMEVFNESGRGLFKIKHDPRVTLAGRFLRRFSLDELPQLWNVLKGDMSLVGPRPLPLRDYENYYEEWHYGRHSGLPGLTGLWQVSGRSDIDFENMCILDLYLLRNESWILDLKILLKTFWVVLFARGAY